MSTLSPRTFAATLITTLALFLLPATAFALEGWARLQIAGVDIVGDSGGVISLGRQNMIQVLDLGWGAGVPVTADGLVSGPMQLRSVKLHKRVDQASPHIARALGQNQVVNRLEIRFFRPAPDGTTQHYFTYLFENARVVDIAVTGDSPVQPPAAGSGLLREVVSIVYQRATVTHEEGGISYILESGAAR